MTIPFTDRTEAGRELALVLEQRLGERLRRAVVLALPRGGVPVAYEVAEALDLPLDVLVVRKLGTPGQEELAMGAIAGDAEPVLNMEVVDALGISPEAIAREVERERAKLRRREAAYRDGRTPVPVAGRVVIVIDDGLATGASMRAAVRALRARQPEATIVAVPVAARESCDELEDEADEVLCVHTPEPFRAVGLWYRDFEPTTDDEVRTLLASAAARSAGPPPGRRP